MLTKRSIRYLSVCFPGTYIFLFLSIQCRVRKMNVALGVKPSWDQALDSFVLMSVLSVKILTLKRQHPQRNLASQSGIKGIHFTLYFYLYSIRENRFLHHSSEKCSRISVSGQMCKDSIISLFMIPYSFKFLHYAP